MSGHVDRSVLREHALGAPLGAQAEAHLADCEACRRGLAGERELARRIDAELLSALACEPSPGFDARVRARLRDARRAGSRPAAPRLLSALGPPRGRLAWAAAAALVVAIAWLAPRPTRGPTMPRETRRDVPPPAQRDRALPPRPAPGEGAQRSRSLDAGPAAVPAPPRDAALRASAGRPTKASRSARQPRVLVPRGEVVALARFVAGRARWRLDESGVGAPAEIAPLEIAPLVIEPVGWDE